MSRPQIIGFTGKMGAGKDTAFDRLQALFGAHVYCKASFAAPLKASLAALLNVNVDVLEAWKNEPKVRLTVVDLSGGGRDLGRSFSIREVMQRYGTEAHRDIFGEDFWVTAAMADVARSQRQDAMLRIGPKTHVFTDVRFENEARAIREAGGLIYEIVGPNADTGDHPSEAGVPEGLIEWGLDNTLRPSFDEMTGPPQVAEDALRRCRAHLDDEVAKLHAEMMAL